MEILDALMVVFSLETITMILLGVFAGIIIGALPGLTVNMGIALLLPLTYSFQGMTGILLLLGMYCGAVYGGSITAILISTPGTPASAATVLDGYPMAKKGEAGRALGLSTMGSMFGGVFSTIALIVIAPQLAKVATGLFCSCGIWHKYYYQCIIAIDCERINGGRDWSCNCHYRA